MKDKQWYRDKLEDLKDQNIEMWKQAKPNSKERAYFNGYMAATITALDYLDQLDESNIEQLQESIKRLDKYNSELISDNNQLREALEGSVYTVLEKPTVPQYVADFYEYYKNDINQGIYDLCRNHDKYQFNSKLIDWMMKTQNNFAEILIRMQDGYEVEFQQRYAIQIDTDSDSTRIVKVGETVKGAQTTFTEEEIRAMDKGDLLFEHFAVLVEEEEE